MCELEIGKNMTHLQAAPQEAEQNRGYRIQDNGLTSYKQDGDDRIKEAMLGLELVQPVAQNMED